jgi:uncharacterized lipoprotein YmbA
MKSLRSPASIRCVAIVAAFFAVSCLGSSPKVNFYTMSPVSRTPGSSVSNSLAVGVGPIRVPRYLDRPEWVERSGNSNSQLEVDGVRRWAGGFSSNVLSVLGENMAAKLQTDRVIVYPAQTAFPLDYRIAVDFHAFEVIGGDALELRASWVVRAGSGDRGPWTGHSVVRESVSGGGDDGFVAAHNKALAQLAETIASRIESLAKEEAAMTASGDQSAD